MKFQLIKKIFGYYSDKMYRFDHDELIPVEDQNFKAVVVARHHYIERSLALPITIRKDVKAAIAFEIENLKLEFHVFYKIAPSKNGETIVTLWQIPKSIINNKTLMVLPETFLLAHILSPNTLLSYSSLVDENPVYLIQLEQGIKSFISNGQSKEFFCHAIGIHVENDVQIKATDFVATLLKSISAAFMSMGLNFFIKSENDKQKIIDGVKPYILPFGVFITLYIAISSAYLSYQLSATEQLANSYKKEINAVLTIQKTLNQLTDEIEKYQEIGSEKQPLWQIWKIIEPLYQQNVSFQFIRFNGEKVLFKATAKSASAVLEYMQNNTLSRNSAFTSGVRKEGDVESFIIQFDLIPLGEQSDTE